MHWPSICCLHQGREIFAAFFLSSPYNQTGYPRVFACVHLPYFDILHLQIFGVCCFCYVIKTQILPRILWLENSIWYIPIRIRLMKVQRRSHRKNRPTNMKTTKKKKKKELSKRGTNVVVVFDRYSLLVLWRLL